MLRRVLVRLRRPSHPVRSTFHSLSRSSAAVQLSPNVSRPQATSSEQQLKESFDTPSPPSFSSSEFLSPTGLFDQPNLTTPSGFPLLASRTTLRATFLVERICTPTPPPQSLEEAERDFLNMVKKLDRLSDLLCSVIDLAELVRNVHPDREWMEGANEAYEDLCEFMNGLNTHVGLYEALKTVHSRLPSTTPSKSPALFAAYAVAVPFLRDFEKSGIHLPSSQRATFVELSSEIIRLGRTFLQNSAEPKEPVSLQSEEVEESMGPLFSRKWFGSQKRMEVDPLSMHGRVLCRQASNEDLRRRLYLATYSAPGEHVEVLEELLKTRSRLANLVGRESWAEVALEDKMAKSPENVMGFLKALNKHNRPLALKDLRLLEQAKADYLGVRRSNVKVNAWDRDFFSDQVPSSASNLPDITPFFSVGSCFQGLSKLFSSLYGIRFEVDDVKPGEGWHHQVKKMKVIDEEEGRIGTIYCDLFNREGKQPGAAHYTVRCSRRVDDDDAEADFGKDAGKSEVEVDGVMVPREELDDLMRVEPVTYRGRGGQYQHPIVVLVCGFGVDGQETNGPTFLYWHEVETLFHEMGHAIHSMMGRTDYHNVAGTRCATDFVELPSILMEHFISSPSVLSSFAHHTNTGRSLPPDILSSLLADRQRFSALETSTQITMAALDQAYHSSEPLEKDFDSTDLLRQAHERFHVIPHAEGTSWQTQFGHLFGYGATYYSYLFDRAIAAQIFSSKFADDPMNRDAGDEFKRKVLRWGGGKDPWEMVGEMVGSEEVMKGGKRAMESVGQWGIEESKNGR